MVARHPGADAPNLDDAMDADEKKKKLVPQTRMRTFVAFVLCVLMAAGLGALLLSEQWDKDNEGGGVVGGGRRKEDENGGNRVGDEGQKEEEGGVESLLHRLWRNVGMESLPESLAPAGLSGDAVRPPVGASEWVFRQPGESFEGGGVGETAAAPRSRGRKRRGGDGTTRSVNEADLVAAPEVHPVVGGTYELRDDISEWRGWDVSSIVQVRRQHAGDQIEIWRFGALSAVQRTIEGLRLARAGLDAEAIAYALSTPAALRAHGKAALRTVGAGIAIVEFGFGAESALWDEQNRPGGENDASAGTTLHLATQGASETPSNTGAWEKAGCDDVCRSHTSTVSYWTTLGKHNKPEFYHDPKMINEDALVKSHATLKLWKTKLVDTIGEAPATNTHLPYFDVIIVRAPGGYDPITQPGRMQSISTAAKLAGPGSHLFVNDCPRDTEKRWTEVAFPPAFGAQHNTPLAEALNSHAMHVRKNDPTAQDTQDLEEIPAAVSSAPYWTAGAVKRYLGLEALTPPIERSKLAKSAWKWVLLERVDDKLCHFRRVDASESWPGNDT